MKYLGHTNKKRKGKKAWPEWEPSSYVFFSVPLILFTSSQISEAALIWQASDLHRTLEILFQMSKQNYKDPRGWSTDFRSLQQTRIISKGHRRCKHLQKLNAM